MKTLKLGLISGLIGEAVLWSAYMAFRKEGAAGMNNVVDAVWFLHTLGISLAHALHISSGYLASSLMVATGVAQLALVACVGMEVSQRFQARRSEQIARRAATRPMPGVQRNVR